MFQNEDAKQRWMDAARIGFMEWGVPLHVQTGLLNWVVDHLQPGDFLSAVLRNDLRDACCRADEYNRLKLWAIVAWLHNHATMNCWGSEDRFEAWAAARNPVAKGGG